MSTDLLQRKMDLDHHFHTDGTNYGLNTLTMDTSYPVKLSGMIVKVFKAKHTYVHTDKSNNEFSDDKIMFRIQNEKNETILQIPKKNVLDFSRNPFPTTEKQNYTEDDYVLAIIDFNDTATDTSRNNGVILIHTLHGIGGDVSIYEKYFAYYCNGKNDNVVLGDIINIITDLYGYNEDIVYNQTEFEYSIKDKERKEIYENNKMTIEIIGKFGIDYSQTDFVYGKFNRQNRSTIMKISGYSSKNTNSVIEEENNYDMELVLDFKRCYIPKIDYDSNEKYAALYNTRLKGANIDEYVDYWEYNDPETKAKSNHAHFSNPDTKNPYGNLFPRRLVFMSVEGVLPLNITIKNMCVTSFGVGIYCETESNKTIKIEDCKFTVLNAFDRSIISMIGKDIESVDYYKQFKCMIPFGCAIDINCFNAKVDIKDTKIRNGSNVYTGELIMNSSKNMRISNCDILGFAQYKDSYKYAYTFPYLDYDFNPDFYFEIKPDCRSFINIGNIDTTKLSLEQCTDFNYLEVLILNKLFYSANYMSPSKRLIKYTDMCDYLSDNGKLITTLSEYKLAEGGTIERLYSYLSPLDLLSNKNDRYQGNFFTCLKPDVILSSDITEDDLNNIIYADIIQYSNLSGDNVDKNEPISRTCGIIKNLPITFKDAYYTINEGILFKDLLSYNQNTTSPSPTNTYFDSHFNQQSRYQPCISLINSRIESDGLIYQAGGSIDIDNCILNSKLYDYKYQSCQINIVNGTVNISNCKIDFDTAMSRNGTFLMNWIDDNPLTPTAFIRISPNQSETTLSILNELQLVDYNMSSKLNDNIYTTYASKNVSYGDFAYFIYGCAVKSFNRPVLNMINTNITTHVDFKFNIINSTLAKPSVEEDGFNTYVYTPNCNINKENKSVSFKLNKSSSPKLAVIYSNNYRAKIGNDNYFNPLIDPIINVSSTNFYFDNSLSLPEYSNLGESSNNGNFSDVTNSNALGIIVKVDTKKIKNKALNVFSGSSDDFKNKVFSQIDGVYTGIKTQNLSYHNIITEYTRSRNYGTNLDVFTDVDRVIIHYFNLSNGIIYHFDITKETSSELKIQESQTITQVSGDEITSYEKLISMGITNYYQFFESLSTIDYADFLYFTKIYGSDLPQTGYYIYNNITDYLAYQSNNNINPASALVNLNTSVFEVSNVVMNVNNCNIGGIPNAIRNTYNGETFIKHCPRIAFQLENNGIYNISNTNAYAWATVLWSNLTDNITSIFNRQIQLYNPGNAIKYGALNDTLDKSTIDMSKGSCVVDNCNFINYNASRFYYNKIDKVTLLSKGSTLLNNNDRLILKNDDGILDNSNNKYLDRFVYNDINNKTNTIIVQDNSGLDNGYRNYNEAYLNANEMPIIFINNLDQVRTEINNSIIRGNEIFIACGSVKVNSSTIVNNSNALLFYLYKKTISSNPSLLVKNSKLIAIKDVIDNRYIDHNNRRHQYMNNNVYVEEPYYDNDTNTGYKLTEDKVVAIYGLMNNKISLINNQIEFKCNRYNIDCGIDYQTSIRFILSNQQSTNSNNLSEVILDGNTFDVLFDGGTTSGGYAITYPENITNTNNIRTVPNSRYLSIIEISSKSISNNTPNHTRPNTIIKNNDFNIGSIFLSGCKYIYPFYRTTAYLVSRYALKKRHDLNSLYTVKQPSYDNIIDIKLPTGTKQNIDCKLNISCRYDLVIENCEKENNSLPPSESASSVYFGKSPNKIYAHNPNELDLYSAVIKDENNKQSFVLNIAGQPDYYQYYNITYSVTNDFDTLSYTNNDTINLYTALDTYQIKDSSADENKLEEIKSNTYMLTNFNTPILFIEFDGKNKFVDTNITIKDNTFYNGGVSAGKQIYDDQNLYNNYIKENIINTGSTTGVILNSPCILDISPLWTPTQEEFEGYNSFTVLNSDVTFIDAYPQHKGISINVSDNTFIGNRSQAYYYKGLLTVYDNDKPLSSDKCQYTLKYHDKSLNMDVIDECLLFKNVSSSTDYDFKVLNKLHSNDEIEQKYYKTKLDTGLRDQFLNGYTFTNSYAIKLNSRMTNNFFTLYDLKKILRVYTGSLFQDIGLSGTTRVYTKDSNNQFTYKGSIQDLYPNYKNTLHFRISPNESSDDSYWKYGIPSSIEMENGNYVNDLSLIKVPIICKIHTDDMKSHSDGEEEQSVRDQLKTWETVGWVSISDVRLFYQVEMVKAHSHLIEPINGHVISMKGYWGDEAAYPNDWYKSWVETFANKGFSNTNPISVSTQGSSYSPLAAANSFGIDYTNYTNNISIKNNSFLYDNMQTMNKADNDARVLPMNKERFRRMLLDIAGDL